MSKEGLFVQDFFDVFGYLSSKGFKLDTNSTHQNIVKPLLEKCKKNRSNLSLHVADLALECDMAVGNIKKVEKLLFDNFKEFAFFHRRASRLTKVIIKIIE